MGSDDVEELEQLLLLLLLFFFLGGGGGPLKGSYEGYYNRGLNN